MRALKYFLVSLFLIGLLFTIWANVLVTHNETDYTQGTDNNTFSSDANVVLAIESGTTLYSTGDYLSKIFDFTIDTNVNSFFWYEDYNYGAPLPDNQQVTDDINMSGNIALYHMDENLNDTTPICDRSMYWYDGDSEKTGFDTSYWTTETVTATKDISSPYAGTQSIKLVATGTTHQGVYQAAVVPYWSYVTVKGYYITDGSTSAEVNINGVNNILGSATSWTYFEASGEHPNCQCKYICDNNVGNIQN